METKDRPNFDADNSFPDKSEVVFSATFTFASGEYDEDFHRLNDLIEQAAENSPGFVEKESWISPDGTKRSIVYYWNSREALRTFSKHPDHIEAKRRYKEWYDGYKVVIARVLSYREDGGLSVD